MTGCLSLRCTLPLTGCYSKSTKCSKKLAVDFSRNGRSPLYRCVGMLDGFTINIIKLPASDINPDSLLQSKRIFCTEYAKSLWPSAEIPFPFFRDTSSTHDHLTSKCAVLIAKQWRQALLSGYWVVRDKGYICSQMLLTPRPSHCCDKFKDCFNYHLPSVRMTIE